MEEEDKKKKTTRKVGYVGNVDEPDPFEYPGGSEEEPVNQGGQSDYPSDAPESGNDADYEQNYGSPNQ
jgi:hypothetical protein